MSNLKPIASIEFIKGIIESVKPKIKISRSKDGKSGEAVFQFKNPKTLSIENISSINKMIMTDKEGELISTNINIKQINKGDSSIEVKYKWKSYIDFHRFIRFAENYCQSNFNGELN
tara:strand:+ start:224 stop:574 length:351 start_codon:yes stop_codon:yes gene_type:complete